MTSEIRHIVFDIGRVLIHYDPHIPYSRLIPDEAQRNWFFANICTHDWNIEQDRGRAWEDAEILLINDYPEQEELIRAFRKYWHEMVSHAYVESVAIMEGLIADGRDVTMLTNFAADTFKEARKLYPFLNSPRGVTVSGEYGTLGKGMHAGLPGHSFVLIDSNGRQRWYGEYPSMWLAPEKLIDEVRARLA